jgi:hypothetical protein
MPAEYSFLGRCVPFRRAFQEAFLQHNKSREVLHLKQFINPRSSPCARGH